MEKRRDKLFTDACAALGLQPGASGEEVRAAYDAALRRARQDEGSWERAKEIECAFETLRGSFPEQPAGLGIDRRREAHQGGNRLAAFLFPAPERGGKIGCWPRACLLLVMAAWGARFILEPVEGDYAGRSFMHLINLPFHEAGHLLCAFLGDFLRVLGGTLMQVAVPLVCLVAFLRQAEPFGASCCLWWTGQSLIDTAPYIFDARAGRLMLLGGRTGQDNPDFHDWHNILARLDMLPCDHALAYAAKATGACLMILSLAWGAWALVRQYEIVKRGK